MAPLPRSNIQNFNLHPSDHLLKLYDANEKYLCEGCMIPGTGKRYHCHECNFNMHEYCYTCPTVLSTFMHIRHSLKLVRADNHRVERICNVCCDRVEGLFYRCDLCEFDVHPICTQLPETLHHVLHKAHPLRLVNSSEPGSCAVCRGACNAWRYWCGVCGGPDIHIACVLIPCEKQTTRLGITTYVPPSVSRQYFGGNYAIGVPPCWNNPNPIPNYRVYPSSSSYNTHHPYMPQPQYHNHSPNPNLIPSASNMHPYYYTPQAQPQPQPENHGGSRVGRIGQVMFELVKTLGIGVISNVIFGVDLSFLFVA